MLRRVILWWGCAALLVSGAGAGAQSGAGWLRVPAAGGHLEAEDIAVVINQADPYSVAVGKYYAKKRGLAPEQIVRVDLPLQPSLSPAEFEAFKAQLDERLGRRVQALALAWAQPY
ncbi:MAG TPA: hypothetical protein VJN44_03245, partial [Roseateles sp.]|nr:hypothetical protein [Roseateles sp.]